MSYPARCEHNVILCDRCASIADDVAARRALDERTTKTKQENEKLVAENAALKTRVRDLEQKLTAAGDDNYELKDRIRQLETVNEELRSVGQPRKR